MNAKSRVRKLYRGIRDGLDASERARKSALIVDALLSAPFLAGSGPVMTYVSMGSEVGTHEIINRSLGAGRRVYVPKINDQNSLEWIWLRELSELERGRFGVLESRAAAVEPHDAPTGDAPVLVPGLAFTVQGDRLGQGKGYFDRFLAGHKGLRVGLAYEAQIAPELPTEPHDERVDVIVTERGVVSTRARGLMRW